MRDRRIERYRSLKFFLGLNISFGYFDDMISLFNQEIPFGLIMWDIGIVFKCTVLEIFLDNLHLSD